MGKLLKFIIILIAILIGIGYFSGVEVSLSDNQTSSSTPTPESSEAEKLAQAVGKEVEKNAGCKVGYYKNSSKSDCLKVPENALSAAENWYCKSGYYKNKTKTRCLKVPENSTMNSSGRNWYCNSGYTKYSTNETEGCIKREVFKEYKLAKKVKTNNKSKPDKWWEKTKKYQICYGNVTAAHKANGLHTRNRDKSIEVKKQLCKIAATSTTGEGSFWLQ